MQTKNYYTKHLLKVKMFSLKTYSDSIIKGKKVEFDKCKNRFIVDLKLMIKYTMDISIYTHNSTYRLHDNLENFLSDIKLQVTLESLIESIKNNRRYLDYDIDAELNVDTIKNILESYYYSGSNNLCESTYRTITQPISTKGTIKIFDPQCGNGDHVMQFAKSLRSSDFEVYGLDEEQFGIYEAKEKLNRTIIGTLRGSKISNEVFDILFLEPRPQIELEHNFNGSIKESNEKNLLKQTYRFLKPEGLLIYTAPYYRIYNDMWYFIARNFSDINIIMHNTYDKLVTIYAVKKANKEYTHTFDYYSNLRDDLIDSRINEVRYKIEGNENEVQLFRGSVIDVHELADMINNDGLYNDFYKTFNSSTEKKDKRPMLPFNLGQIGLILTSGELDGIVEEIPGVNHIIKGMTVKTVDSEEIKDSSNNTVTCKNTISNMVQLNAFTANGDFININ